MYLKFSKNEILALERFCAKDFSVGELAAGLGKKESYASRLVAGLERKGLVYRKESRIIALSPSSHAQSFKELYISRPDAKIEGWLSGYSIAVLVLSSFGGEGVPTDIFWEEIPCSKPTAYGILKKLQGAGIVGRAAVSIRTVDRLAESFANDYANNIVRIAASPIKRLKASMRIRNHVVIRAEDREAPPPFVPTGMNVLAEHGLEAMLTSYNDYYFNLDGKARKNGVEEAFIHALYITTLEQHQDKPVLALFLMKNRGKLNMRRLKALARQYAVEGELATMRDALDYVEKAV